jgi:hypothetical protein
MSKVMKVISVLSLKYNFSAEEGLKFYEESNVKKEKKTKKVKKVEVEDIFVEMSRVENVVDDVVDNVDNQEKVDKVVKENKVKVVKEKKVKVVKEKKVKEDKDKKPRTEKQVAAFEKMKAKRAENLKAKKDLASVVSTPSDPASDPASDPEVVEVEAVVEVEEDEVSVSKFSHEGKEYLISSENTLYDPDSEEAVGRWNGSTIEAIGELEEEEIVE